MLDQAVHTELLPMTTLKKFEMRFEKRLGVRAVAEEVNFDKESVRRILREELNMRKFCAKMVPKFLSYEQKERHKELFLDFCNALRINQIC